MDVAWIVQKITGYLDLKQLLQVRLVNNLWNGSAQLHIKKHYISLESGEKICNMMELLTEGFPLQKFDILVSLRTQNLKNLIRKFGKSFEAYRFNGSKLSIVSAETTEALMDILQNSPNLQILEFYNDFAADIVLAQTTEFSCLLPKLNSFTFRFSTLRERDQETRFLTIMLDASPSLQYLKIKNINVELSFLIAVVANRNIKAVHLKRISKNSFQDNSSFSEKFSLELASVSVTTPSALITKFNEFLQSYSSTMRYLRINGTAIHSVQFPAMKYLETLKLGDYGEEDNSQAQFFEGQFPCLKRLRLKFRDSQKLLNHHINSKLPFQNLNQLELIFYYGPLDESDRLPASIELPLDQPLLEILRVQSHSVTNITFPKKVNLRKLIMHNGFEFEQLHLQFPNLKQLHIIIDQFSEPDV